MESRLSFSIVDHEVESTINAQLSNAKFEEWTFAYVKHLVLVSIGINGSENKLKALTLLKSFLLWEVQQSHEWFQNPPKNEIVLMPKPGEIQQWIFNIEHIHQQNYTQEYVDQNIEIIAKTVFDLNQTLKASCWKSYVIPFV